MPTKLSGKFKSAIFIILIIILGFTIYFNSLGGDFIWDDFNLIKGNIYIRNWSGLSQVFTKSICAGIGESSTFYRPLQMATYIADYALWKLDPRGYHLTNILLHLLAALALYWFVKALFNNGILALFSSLLFISHPVQVEAVAYISGRADLLVTIFILISFLSYLKFLQTKKIAAWMMMFCSFIFALLSKENALIFPALLLIYHYAFQKELKIKQFLPLVGVSGIYIGLRLIFMNTVFYDTPVETTFIQRLPGFFAALTDYSRILFLPFNLHMEYGGRLFSFLAPKVILGFCIILFLLVCVLRSRNSNRLVFFSLFWFVIALLPFSNFYPINSYMAEHWLYLPAIGFFIILGNLFTSLYAKENSRFMALGLLICLLSAWSYLTIKQNAYWRSELSFYKRTLEYAPRSGRIYYNLGNLFCDAKDEPQGIQMYLKAIQIDPRYAEAYINLGRAYISLGKNEEGIKYCQIALGIDHNLSKAYYNLGNAYYNLKQKDKSIEMLEKSTKLNPVYIEAYNNLALEYAETGNIDQALRLWNKCVKLKPDFTLAHFNLSVFYFKRKEYDLAIRHCDRVMALGGQVEARFLEELKPFRNKK